VSWTFIGFGFLAMFLGRFVNIAVTTLLFYFCVGKDKWRLNIYELQIITFAGVVRGAVPFALIGTISPVSNASS
jgi:NhaP-type Na+/H+ or K+/H+ antiporter